MYTDYNLFSLPGDLLLDLLEKYSDDEVTAELEQKKEQITRRARADTTAYQINRKYAAKDRDRAKMNHKKLHPDRIVPYKRHKIRIETV